jgi:hypothetical protein
VLRGDFRPKMVKNHPLQWKDEKREKLREECGEKIFTL